MSNDRLRGFLANKDRKKGTRNGHAIKEYYLTLTLLSQASAN
jgi:hypothetical protein